MPGQTSFWIGFNALVVVLLVLDLGVFHRKSQEVKLKEALLMSAFWISLALAFNVGVYYWRGGEKALEFLTGYLVEESLSIDNLFVFLLLFSYFKVPAEDQYRVLFWGIFAALVMRAIFIVAGVVLIQKLHWIIYIFGAFLVYTGIKMFFQKEQQVHPERNPVLKLFRRFVPMTENYEGSKFIVRRNGRFLATPLLMVLVIVDVTDLIFAVDSIPAVLSITHDPFIVYTSNVFAILGLRALFFALSSIMQLFRFLNYGLAGILSFVGAKMLADEFYRLPIVATLSVVGGILAVSIIFSLLFPEKKAA